MVTPLVAPTVMVPCDTASVVISVSPVFGLSDTEIPLSEIAVFSLPLSEAGTVSDTVVVSASVMATVFVPDWRCVGVGRLHRQAVGAVIVDVAGVVRVRARVSAASIAAAVPVSVTVPLPLPPMVTPLVAPTVMVPCDTASVVISVSPVLGPSDTEIPLSEIAVFSLPLSEAGPSPTPSSCRPA